MTVLDKKKHERCTVWACFENYVENSLVIAMRVPRVILLFFKEIKFKSFFEKEKHRKIVIFLQI